MFCPNCGSQNSDVSKFCLQCGTALEVKSAIVAPAQSSSPPISAAPVGGATTFSQGIAQSTNSLTLNSWLVQSERSMHFRCPPGLNVTQEEYRNTLRETAKELELPLQLETLSVTWTDANLHQERIRAKLTTSEPFGLLTGLEYVGRVAFVEQKTYLIPPVLPAEQAPNYTNIAIVGGGLALLGLLLVASRNGFLGYLLILIGIIAAIRMAGSLPQAAKKARAAAVDKWAKDVAELAR